MSSVRIAKLKSLLARVEARRAQPRLRAVQAVDDGPVLSFDDDDDDDDDDLVTEPPPALLLTEKKAAKPQPSPIEDALSLLDQSGPLAIEALSEPITAGPAPSTTLERVGPKAPSGHEQPVAQQPARESAPAPQPSSARAPEAALPPSARAPEAALPPSARAPEAALRPTGVREPTLRFETAAQSAHHTEVEIGPLPDAAPAPDAQQPAARAEPPLSAPTGTVEAAPLSTEAAPARTVSSARIEVPKSFGELLDVSLGLRIR